MKEKFKEYLNSAVYCAREAGKLIIASSKKKKEFTTKTSKTDLVTETDSSCEELIFNELKKQYPTHHFIGEETSRGTITHFSSEPTWIVDPIDGTTNFVHGLPFVAVCIGFSVDCIVRVGVVYNPFLDEMYTAIEGNGAFKNEQTIHTSQCVELSESLLFSEWGSDREKKRISLVSMNKEKLITYPCHGIRSLGSAALNMCYVAEGKADGSKLILIFLSFKEGCLEFGIYIWDIAASSIIVKEAGGVVLDPSGGPINLMDRKVLCSSTIQLANQISPLLVQIPCGKN